MSDEFINNLEDNSEANKLKEHFANMQIKHIDVSLTKDGEMSTHGFVELGSKHHVRHLMSMVKSRNLKLTDFDKVTIKFENTDIDKNRNLALKTAEELIKSDPAARGKAIEQKRSKDRGIYVGGVAAFVQRKQICKMFHPFLLTLIGTWSHRPVTDDKRHRDGAE